MIKFFRKIRQNLLSEGKTGKYLKYAIGEIVLVVIGILIALQINNWNENKINDSKIVASLQAILNEIVKDSLQQVEFIEIAKKEIQHNLKTNLRAESKLATLDTLIQIAKYEFHYRWIAKRVYSSDSYDNLKTSTIYDKVPDSLKTKMAIFYNTQDFWIDALEQANIQFRERLDDYTKTYSVVQSSSSNKEYTYINNIGWTNIDPRHFNPRFYRVMKSHLVLYQYHLQGLEEVQIKSRDLISEIKKQINDKIL